MASAMLVIRNKDQSREVKLAKDSVVLGRSAKCDVVLDSDRVSRRHARLFRDPFGRWIVEDLGSRNGVLVGGKRVRAQAVLPGENVVIGPFKLSLSVPMDVEIAPDPEISASSTMLEAAVDVQVVRQSTVDGTILSGASLKELNRIVDHLAELASPAELYPELCRCMATAPLAAALVIRVRQGDGGSSPSPEILACQLGDQRRQSGSGETKDTKGTAATGDSTNFYLSRRVLDAVCSTGLAVMAHSGGASDGQLELTITDHQRPRAVLCAPLGEGEASVEVLYLDLPLGQAAADIFDLVQAVARQVRLVRKSLLLVEMKAQARVLDRQLSMAHDIQSGLMPDEMPQLAGAEVAVFYEPAMWVGGDYCDAWLLPDGRLAFAIGDVSGKGLPAAMVMSNLQAALRTATSFCPRPAEAMEHLNRHLGQHLPDNMFVTMFLGLFEPGAGRLEFVNAGHIPPLIAGPGHEVRWLGRPSNPVLGVMEDPFTAEVEVIAPGVALLAVTDGITEATSEDGEEFGMTRLEQAVQAAEADSAAALVRLATEEAARFRGTCPPQDDVTVFALLRQGR